MNKNVKSLDLSGNQKITSLDCRRLLDCENLKIVDLGRFVKDIVYLKMALDRLPGLKIAYDEQIAYYEKYKNVTEAIHGYIAD